MILEGPIVQKFRHLMHLDDPEKRVRSRHDVSVNVKYRTANMDGYEEGRLHDISATGLLITTQRKLEKKSHIDIVAVSDEEPSLQIHISATKIRRAGEFNDDEFTYGCVIDDYQLQ